MAKRGTFSGGSCPDGQYLAEYLKLQPLQLLGRQPLRGTAQEVGMTVGILSPPGSAGHLFSLLRGH